jgi:hypothetical protein
LRAEALPPLRPAAFFCAVVPPCEDEDDLPPDPDFRPPLLEAPGEFAIRAARSFDIPFLFSASYCFSFLTLGRFSGIATSFRLGSVIPRFVRRKRVWYKDRRFHEEGTR